MAPASGYIIASFRWRRGGVELSDGPTGTGSIISGATTASLTILRITDADTAEESNGYDCVINNNCGEAVSNRASLTISFCCPSDFDGDGFLTGIDFDIFVHAFEEGDMSADFNGDGLLTGVDFDLFVHAYGAGC